MFCLAYTQLVCVNLLQNYSIKLPFPDSLQEKFQKSAIFCFFNEIFVYVENFLYLCSKFNSIEIDAFNYGEFDIFRNIADGKAKGNYC